MGTLTAVQTVKGAMVLVKLFLATLAVVAAVDQPTPSDLTRAATMVPGPSYMGQGSLSDANRVLNDHLKATKGLYTKVCEDMTTQEIQDTQRTIYGAAHPELLAIYKQAKDNRAMVHTSAE